MKKVISTEKKPIKLWLEDVEDGALAQLKNIANLDFIYKWVATMPDCHQGYGMPIGGVMATQGVVVPNAVGVDIGCGMCAVKTSLTKIDTDTLKQIMEEIRKVIPVGRNHQKVKQDEALMPNFWENPIDLMSTKDYLEKGGYKVVSEQYDSALGQIGTLGSGNHFIEIQKGSDGFIWIMIHSGSRNIGYKVANYYNKLAVKLNEEWHSSVPKEHELAFLPINSEEGKAYMKEMKYCTEFAFANRKLMMERVKDIFAKCLTKKNIRFETIENGIKADFEKTNALETEPMINIAHNYAAWEKHYGKNVLVHRKGATLARQGIIGIIPGSQGTKSYIVEGKGNPESFFSCSHGAGRTMGRKQAIRELSLEGEQKMLDDQGILHSVRGKENLDESPSAYKDISEVMDNQKDLVKILVELTPLAVIKG